MSNRLRCDICGQFVNPKSNWIWVQPHSIGFLSPEDPLVCCENCSPPGTIQEKLLCPRCGATEKQSQDCICQNLGYPV